MYHSWIELYVMCKERETEILLRAERQRRATAASAAARALRETSGTAPAAENRDISQNSRQG